ncbi:hypothetical protein [Lyngbya sp. CCY1209]|uniref:hypothetical protein n=1 Tax=Lyngbya sp. CCY1209 TaxID=2886103 RepID=UPI002D214E0A|nr:hypothetical protein [Lyngbya sp. CCY1209]MEB3884073.1 hypothetical protein [Lyngbya sp. CCY1209]
MFAELLAAFLVAQNQQCDPSYPSDIYGNPICIPINVRDLDCEDLEEAGMTLPIVVRQPDPHRLDGDKDGLGCEGGTRWE